MLLTIRQRASFPFISAYHLNSLFSFAKSSIMWARKTRALKPKTILNSLPFRAICMKIRSLKLCNENCCAIYVNIHNSKWQIWNFELLLKQKQMSFTNISVRHWIVIHKGKRFEIFIALQRLLLKYLKCFWSSFIHKLNKSDFFLAIWMLFRWFESIASFDVDDNGSANVSEARHFR